MEKATVFVCVLMIAISSITFLNINANAQDGLIAEYHFDEGSGSIIGDTSGNSNHGTIYGAVWTNGTDGTALSFDGINDYVTCGTGLTGTVLSEITVQCWFYSKNINNDHWIFYDGSDGEFCLGVRANHTAFFQVKDANQNFYPVYTDSTLTINQWYHIAGIFTGSSIKIYINGELKNNRVIPDVGLFNPSGNYFPTIGAYSGPSNNHAAYFNGTIDELRIFNRALSAQEIQLHYESHYTIQPLIAELDIENQFLNMGEITTFDGSESSGPELSEYYFDFGDEQNSGWIHSHSVSHGYNTPGIYEATLTVRNNTGNVSENTMDKVYVGTKSNFTENNSYLTPLWEVKASQSHPDDECVVYDVAVTNNGIFSAYCVVCGYVDATDYRGVRCYNKDGTLAWDVSRNSGTPYEITMTDDGTISVVRWSNGDIEAYSDNGETLWSHNVPDASAISMCPDGKYVVVGSFIEGANSEVILYESGTLKWAAWTYGGIEDVKISMDGNRIYAGTSERTFLPLEVDNKLYCFSSDGSNLWSKQFTSAVISLDTITDGSIVVLFTDDGNTTVLDDAGNHLWSVNDGWFDPTISANGEIITQGTLTKLLVFNQSGNLIWKNNSFDSSIVGTSYAMVSRSGEIVVHPYGFPPGPYGIIIRDKSGNCLYHYRNASCDSGFRVAVSPDGKYIAAGSGNNLLLLSLNPDDTSETPSFGIMTMICATGLAFAFITISRRKRNR